MIRSRYIVVLLLFAAGPAFAQQTGFRKAYDDFMQSSVTSYKQFNSEANREFANAIREQWESFSLCGGESRLSGPEPDSLSKAPSMPAPPDFQIDIDGVPVEPSKCAWTSGPQTSAGPSHTAGNRMCRFNFYGSVVEVPVPETYFFIHPSGISEKDVGDFWEKLCGYDYQRTVASFETYSSRNALNDWACYEWTVALAKEIFPENTNCEQEIFTVFFINQVGLSGRIGRTDKSLVCLFSSAQKIYARKYINLEGTRYYLAGNDIEVSQLYTYSFGQEHGLRPFDMRMAKHPNLGGESIGKCLRSEYFKCDLTFPLNRQDMLFYGNYPQTDVCVYAQSCPSGEFAEALTDFLRPHLSGKSGVESLNLLLTFLHRDFRYRTDQEQFGYEKPFFCEENFCYDFNDCEDRSVLFCFLVRELLGMSTMLVEYPAHVVCAVRIDEPATGCYIKRGDSRYYICDPTYLGSSVGMSSVDKMLKPQKIWVIN